MFGTDCHLQLKRIDSIWLSAIMKPESRSKENRRFLVDVDTIANHAIVKIKKEIDVLNGKIIEQIRTKNGWHFITTPFDKSHFPNMEEVEIKTDALLFLEHIGG